MIAIGTAAIPSQPGVDAGHVEPVQAGQYSDLVTSPEIVQANHALLAFRASRLLCAAGRPLVRGHGRGGLDGSLARAAARVSSALQLRLEPLDLLLDTLHLWLQLRVQLAHLWLQLCVHLP